MNVSHDIVNQKWSKSMDFLDHNINIYQDKPMLVLPITYQSVEKDHKTSDTLKGCSPRLIRYQKRKKNKWVKK